MPPDAAAPSAFSRFLSTTPGRLLVVGFCAWYVVSIGIYAIPEKTTFKPALWLRENVRPLISPSVLLTSQWQRWNLFSPDPLRRVTVQKIERQRDDEWQTIAMLEPDAFPWWRRANHFKLLSNAMEGKNTQMAQRYVQSLCATFALPPDTPLRATSMVSIIPAPHIPQSAKWWRTWRMTFEPRDELMTSCPDIPPVALPL
jgi:hypothetical protein